MDEQGTLAGKILHSVLLVTNEMNAAVADDG